MTGGAVRYAAKVALFRAGQFIEDTNGDKAYTQSHQYLAGGDTIVSSYGSSGDVGLTGNWRINFSGTYVGNRYNRVGIYHTSIGQFFLDRNGSNAYEGSDESNSFGVIDGVSLTNEVPAVRDWDGSGYRNVGIYDTSNGNVYFDIEGNGI